MNPFFFGSSSEQLYGVYHPPHASAGRSTGVLLCYPLGQEYMRAHRAFRQLAYLLSRAGFPVMRFDYYGTGDSAGDSGEISLHRWVRDIGTAVEELKETAEVERVTLVGLRLGASLAALASDREDVERLVLWDPIMNGREYAEALRGSAAAAWAEGGAGGVLGVNGFPIPERFLSELVGLELAGTGRPGMDVLLIVPDESAPEPRLAQTLRNAGSTVTYAPVASPGDWQEVDDFGSALIPQAIIRLIVDHVSGGVHA